MNDSVSIDRGHLTYIRSYAEKLAVYTLLQQIYNRELEDNPLNLEEKEFWLGAFTNVTNGWKWLDEDSVSAADFKELPGSCQHEVKYSSMFNCSTVNTSGALLKDWISTAEYTSNHGANLKCLSLVTTGSVDDPVKVRSQECSRKLPFICTTRKWQKFLPKF